MKEYRMDFPMLNSEYIYFNNASTSFKPKCVIDSISKYYYEYGVNTNRGIDTLGYKVTQMFENTRKKVSEFINSNTNEIVFTRGTTDSINLIANSFGNMIINEDDEIIISVYEHHSNFLPWQELCKRKNAKLIIVDAEDDGTINPITLDNAMNEKTKIVALNHVSNVMGSINNIKELSKVVHKHNAYFVVDGAQGIVNEKIDVKDNDVDFYAFSAHKLYGPMGVGVLYGKYELLDKMPPIIFGGEMIDVVTIEKSTYKLPPYKFEAGTMMVPEVIAFGTAIDYINNIGFKKMNSYTNELRNYLLEELMKIKDIEIYNSNVTESHIITFNIKNVHAHDVATFLDSKKIILRAGHHCAEPLMTHLGVPATVRISLAFYNTKEECDKFVQVLKEVGDYVNVLF